MLGNYIERIGSYIIGLIESLGEIGLFLYRSFYASFTPPFNGRLILEQIDEIGFKSIPIVIVSAMAIGMVMVVQLAWGFAWFGATNFLRGSAPIVLKASICSVTFIEPISAVIPAPTLPPTRSEVTTGPSSLTKERETTGPTTPFAPNQAKPQAS